MKIFLNIEADSPGEMASALYTLGTMAGHVEVAGPAPVADGEIYSLGTNPASEPIAEPTPAAEPAKRTRRTKAEIAADAAATVDGAKPETPAEPEPLQNTAASADGKGNNAAAATEPPPVTIEELRNEIIDHLNDWNEAVKDIGGAETTYVDGQQVIVADIRKFALAKILEPLGAQKITGIDPSDFPKVPGVLDESRARLAAFKAARAVEE